MFIHDVVVITEGDDNGEQSMGYKYWNSEHTRLYLD